MPVFKVFGLFIFLIVFSDSGAQITETASPLSTVPEDPDGKALSEQSSENITHIDSDKLNGHLESETLEVLPDQSEKSADEHSAETSSDSSAISKNSQPSHNELVKTSRNEHILSSDLLSSSDRASYDEEAGTKDLTDGFEHQNVINESYTSGPFEAARGKYAKEDENYKFVNDYENSTDSSDGTTDEDIFFTSGPEDENDKNLFELDDPRDIEWLKQEDATTTTASYNYDPTLLKQIEEIFTKGSSKSSFQTAATDTEHREHLVNATIESEDVEDDKSNFNSEAKKEEINENIDSMPSNQETTTQSQLNGTTAGSDIDTFTTIKDSSINDIQENNEVKNISGSVDSNTSMEEESNTSVDTQEESTEVVTGKSSLTEEISEEENTDSIILVGSTEPTAVFTTDNQILTEIKNDENEETSNESAVMENVTFLEDPVSEIPQNFDKSVTLSDELTTLKYEEHNAPTLQTTKAFTEDYTTTLATVTKNLSVLHTGNFMYSIAEESVNKLVDDQGNGDKLDFNESTTQESEYFSTLDDISQVILEATTASTERSNEEYSIEPTSSEYPVQFVENGNTWSPIESDTSEEISENVTSEGFSEILGSTTEKTYEETGTIFYEVNSEAEYDNLHSNKKEDTRFVGSTTVMKGIFTDDIPSNTTDETTSTIDIDPEIHENFLKRSETFTTTEYSFTTTDENDEKVLTTTEFNHLNIEEKKEEAELVESSTGEYHEKTKFYEENIGIYEREGINSVESTTFAKNDITSPFQDSFMERTIEEIMHTTEIKSDAEETFTNGTEPEEYLLEKEISFEESTPSESYKDVTEKIVTTTGFDYKSPYTENMFVYTNTERGELSSETNEEKEASSENNLKEIIESTSLRIRLTENDTERGEVSFETNEEKEASSENNSKEIIESTSRRIRLTENDKSSVNTEYEYISTTVNNSYLKDNSEEENSLYHNSTEKNIVDEINSVSYEPSNKEQGTESIETTSISIDEEIISSFTGNIESTMSEEIVSTTEIETMRTESNEYTSEVEDGEVSLDYVTFKNDFITTEKLAVIKQTIDVAVDTFLSSIESSTEFTTSIDKEDYQTNRTEQTTLNTTSYEDEDEDEDETMTENESTESTLNTEGTTEKVFTTTDKEDTEEVSIETTTEISLEGDKNSELIITKIFDSVKDNVTKLINEAIEKITTETEESSAEYDSNASDFSEDYSEEISTETQQDTTTEEKVSISSNEVYAMNVSNRWSIFRSTLIGGFNNNYDQPADEKEDDEEENETNVERNKTITTTMLDETVPYIKTNVFGSDANVSIKIKIKNTTFYVPPSAYFEKNLDRNILNITWTSSSMLINNTLMLSLKKNPGIYSIQSVQLNLARGNNLDVWNKSLTRQEKNISGKTGFVVELEDDVRISFSNLDFLRVVEDDIEIKTGESELTSSAIRIDPMEIGIASACIAAALLVCAAIYFVISKSRKRVLHVENLTKNDIPV